METEKKMWEKWRIILGNLIGVAEREMRENEEKEVIHEINQNDVPEVKSMNI